MIEIALKDLKVFFRDIKAVLLSFLLPIGLITLFGLTFGGIEKRSETQNQTAILVSDLDSTATTRDVIAKLDSLDEISVTTVDFSKGKDQIMNGNRLAMLVFYKGFADSVESGKPEPMELFYDEARKMDASLIQYALISNLMEILGPKTFKKKIMSTIKTKYPDLDTDMMSQIEGDISEQFAPAGSGDNENNPMGKMGNLTVTSLARKESVNWALIQSFAGTAVMMLLFSVTAIGSSLLSEREDGTLKRLMYSPVSPIHIMFGKVLFALVISVIQLSVMIVFTWAALGMDLGYNLFYLMMVVVATAFACSGFGIFIAAISTSRKQSESMATIVILLMSAIGGSMIPLFFMPAFMQKIAVISLNYWAIQGFFDVLGREVSFLQVIIKVGVLIGIGATMMAISASLFKRNLLKVL
jgi:ABC-type multidrug transport system permease subunit